MIIFVIVYFIILFLLVQNFLLAIIVEAYMQVLPRSLRSTPYTLSDKSSTLNPKP